jgi:hypothetical protein
MEPQYQLDAADRAAFKVINDLLNERVIDAAMARSMAEQYVREKLASNPHLLHRATSSGLLEAPHGEAHCDE